MRISAKTQRRAYIMYANSFWHTFRLQALSVLYSLSVAVIIIAAHTVDVLLLFSLLFYLFPHRMPPS